MPDFPILFTNPIMSKIPYNLSKIRAIVFDVDGVLSPTTVPMSPEGVPQRMANLKDGYAMVTAIKNGLHLAIISGADTRSIIGRFAPIGLHDVYLGVLDKLPLLKEYMESKGLSPDEVAYIGDDIPDIPCLKHVGLAVTPRDGAQECKDVATYITLADGGYGVAREVVEEVLKAQNLWPVTGQANGR